MRYLELFEDAQLDINYRNKSKDIYNDLFYKLKNTNVKILEIKHDDESAWAIPTMYPDLYIGMSTKISENNAVFVGDIKRKYIILPLKNNQIPPSQKDFYNLILSNDDLLIHEIIHYFDIKRMKAIKNSFITDDPVKYYNNPMELNAYYHQAINGIMRWIEMYQEEKYGFKKFYNHVMEKFFEQRFVQYLTPENKRKLAKRLFGFWKHNIQNN